MRQNRFLWLIVTASLLLALSLVFDLIPFLRGGFGWQWPYKPVLSGRTWLFLLGVGLYVLGGWWLLRRSVLDRLIGLWSIIGAVLIPVLVVGLRADNVLAELFVRTASGVTTGPHLAATEIDWASNAWHDWPAVMQSFEGRSVHVALSPPGLPMIYGVLNAGLTSTPELAQSLQQPLLSYQCHNWNLLRYSPAEWASAWFGMLMPVWSALGVFPLYAIARRLAGIRARMVILWWPLVPAVAMFTPSWNTVYPLFSLIAFWLLLKSLELKRWWLWSAASGLVVGLLTFTNFSLVPLPLLLGCYALLDIWLNRPAEQRLGALRHAVRIGIGVALGVILPWLIFGLVTGLTPIDVLRAAMNQHLSLDRPYLPWLWLHFWEWALLTGIPLTLLALSTIWGRLRGRVELSVLGLALLVTLLALLLSGAARGETGRVWLFLSPFLLITAAEAWNDSGVGVQRWVAVSAVQSVLLVVLAVSWDVIGAPDMQAPPSAPGEVLAAQGSSAVFGELFRLASWDTTVKTGGIELRLNWEGQKPIQVPYWFSALLVSPAGEPAPSGQVWQPVETHFPTTCWKSGERIGDTIWLPLPSDAAPGEWWISLAAFADEKHSEERLSVILPDGAVDTQVGLGPVFVP